MSETTQTNEQGVNHDPLTMSDEDFANMDPTAFEEAADLLDSQTDEDAVDEDAEDEGTDDDAAAESDEPEDDADEEDGVEEDEDTDQDTEEDEDEDSDEEDSDTDADQEGDEDSDSEEDTDGEEDTDESDDEKDSDEVDYKSEYENLMAPFKANGREMKANNVEEARRLMQMGANYNKKMAALKPSLKTVKLLDKHGLNDESKLSHLIDLTKGDKGAIQKLLKDSGVDPLDLDSSEESDYRPNTYNVDDREMELDEVLDSLQDTSTYQQTVDLVSTKWDSASKQIIANNPRVLEVLNDQMANGVYERVSTEVERLRAFGQLTDVSDIEAYKAVGDRMASEGKLNDLGASQKSQGANTDKPPVRKPKAKKPDPKLKQKKRAASSTKTKPASKTPDDFSPLGMSDEEFEKQFDSNLL